MGRASVANIRASSAYSSHCMAFTWRGCLSLILELLLLTLGFLLLTPDILKSFYRLLHGDGVYCLYESFYCFYMERVSIAYISVSAVYTKIRHPPYVKAIGCLEYAVETRV